MLVPKVKKIKEKRINLQLTKSELSKLASLPDNAICRIENSNYNSIHPIRAKAIAKALNCTMEELFDTK